MFRLNVTLMLLPSLLSGCSDKSPASVSVAVDAEVIQAPAVFESAWPEIAAKLTLGKAGPTDTIVYSKPRTNTGYRFRTTFELRPKTGKGRGSATNGQLITVDGASDRWTLKPVQVRVSAQINGRRVEQERPWIAEPFELAQADGSWQVSPTPKAAVVPTKGHTHDHQAPRSRVPTASLWAAGIGMPTRDLFVPLPAKGVVGASRVGKRALAGGPGSVSATSGGRFEARSVDTQYTVVERILVNGSGASVIEAKADAALPDGRESVVGQYVVLDDGLLLYGWIRTQRVLNSGITVVHTGEIRLVK